MADHQKQTHPDLNRSQTILHAKDLRIGYRNGSVETVLFNGIDVKLESGKMVCLMAPNGAGKSTLIRSLAGLQPLLGGVLPHHGEKGVAVVLTDKVNSTHMTVGELIAFGRYPHLDWRISFSQQDKDVVRDVIGKVGIQDLTSRRLYELSDGQLQMVMIARALAQETPLLLLDEPTAHLDLNNRLTIMNLLRQLSRDEDKAILVSTHELDLALQTADIVWLASQGKIRQGIPEDLVLDGSFDEVFQFKGFDLRTGRVQHLPFRKKTVQLEGDGVEFLWTKNALERNGFEVNQNSAVKVISHNKSWQISDKNFASLAAMLEHLATMD